MSNKTIKTYFDVDKILTVTIRKEVVTSMKWFDEIQSKTNKFLGIEIGRTEYKEAGWAWCEYGTRYSSESLKKDEYYRLDESQMKVYKKPSVEIYLNYKYTLYTRFNTDEEAQSYVDELLSQSTKKFSVITQIG